MCLFILCIDKNGYVNTNVFVNVLNGMDKSRKLEDSDMTWLRNNSSIKGKVNYKHIFKKLNLFKSADKKQQRPLVDLL